MIFFILYQAKGSEDNDAHDGCSQDSDNYQLIGTEFIHFVLIVRLNVETGR